MSPDATALVLLRGAVVLVELDPAVGNEQGKTRPAVVVSNDTANRAAALSGRGVITVVPITSNVEAVYPFQCLIEPGASGLAHHSKAQAEQVRAISIGRAVRALGRIDAETMSRLDDALRIHLVL
jgi:Growth inhibitor